MMRPGLLSSRANRLGRVFAILVVLLESQCLRAEAAQQYPDPPQVLFKDLFVAVEMDALFSDSKEFADAVPKSSPSDILNLYHSQGPRSRTELNRFLERHFELPRPAFDLRPVTRQAPIQEHNRALWDGVSGPISLIGPLGTAGQARLCEPLA
jgi:neutral trehalase